MKISELINAKKSELEILSSYPNAHKSRIAKVNEEILYWENVLDEKRSK